MPTSLTISDRQLAISASEGVKHLDAADWSASVRPTEEFLALLALRIVLAGYLVGDVKRSTDASGATTIEVTLDGRPAPAARKAAAQLVVAPLGAYAELAGLSFASHANDTGAIAVPVLIVGGVVAVSAIVSGAVVLYSVANRATEIVDKALKRNAASAEIQKADAQALALVNNHVQRELAAGRTLALDDATNTALGAVKTRIQQLIGLGFTDPEKPNTLPSWVLPVAGLTAAAVVTAVIYNKVKKS
jgi:hypothetical protein